jgi:hypothetical protein
MTALTEMFWLSGTTRVTPRTGSRPRIDADCSNCSVEVVLLMLLVLPSGSSGVAASRAQPASRKTERRRAPNRESDRRVMGRAP